jgi:hypothetical protein
MELKRLSVVWEVPWDRDEFAFFVVDRVFRSLTPLFSSPMAASKSVTGISEAPRNTLRSEDSMMVTGAE